MHDAVRLPPACGCPTPAVSGTQAPHRGFGTHGGFADTVRERVPLFSALTRFKAAEHSIPFGCHPFGAFLGTASSTPAPTHSMPGAPPAVTTTHIPRHDPVSPGTGSPRVRPTAKN